MQNRRINPLCIHPTYVGFRLSHLKNIVKKNTKAEKTILEFFISLIIFNKFKPTSGIISAFLWQETYGLLHFMVLAYGFRPLPTSSQKVTFCKAKGHHLKL